MTSYHRASTQSVARIAAVVSNGCNPDPRVIREARWLTEVGHKVTIHAFDRGEEFRQIEEIDGVFTYVVATADCLGMAKDTMAAKPMVLFESEDTVALASEEIAIRALIPEEIDTYDPYDEEVRVWQA